MKIEPIVIREEETSLICPFCSKKLESLELKLENDLIYIDGYHFPNKTTDEAFNKAFLSLICKECHTTINIETFGDIKKKVDIK